MRVAVALSLIVLAGCEQPLDQSAFQKRAEKVFVDANPGFGIARRQGMTTTFIRGDQVFTLDTTKPFEEYQAKQSSTGAFFDAWKARLDAEAKARRRTLEAAAGEIVPILKSGQWINVQDLGAIGPKSVQDQIRPWRKQVTDDVFALIGVPEELLGYRYVSLHEVKESAKSPEQWLDVAIKNLARQAATSTGSEIRASDGHLMVIDYVGVPGSAAWVLDREFRTRALAAFGKTEIGAAIPIRDALVLFDHEDFAATKPVRARTHQLYSSQNHPAFRGLLRLSADGISIFEQAEAAPTP